MPGSSGSYAALRRLAFIAALVTCGGDRATGPPPPPPVNSITLIGRSQLRLGETSQFLARTLDAAGNVLTDRTVTWETSAPAIATVTSTGLVTTTGLGQTTVTAASEGKSAAALVTVTAVPVGRVVVTPRIDSLFVGDSLQLAAVVYDSANRVVTDRTVTWAVSDTAKGRVTPSGRAFARTPETFAVTAKADTATGGAFLSGQYRVASLTLPDSIPLPRYDTLIVIPDLRSASGVRLSGRATTWTSRSPAVVDVTPAGMLVPRALGTSVVLADAGGAHDSMRVDVVPQPVLGVDLTTGISGPLTVGIPGQVFAQIVTKGDPAEGHAITWTSSDSSLLGVEPDTTLFGRATVHPRAPGRAVVAAASGTFRDSLMLQVRLGLHHIVLQPESLLVHVGQHYLPPQAELVDSLGSLLDRTYRVTFRTGDPSIALIDSAQADWIRGVSPGRTTLIGTIDNGMADTGTVIVPPPGGLRLRWATPEISGNAFGSVPLTVILADSLDQPLSAGRDVTITADTSGIRLAVPVLPDVTYAATVVAVARRAGRHAIVASVDSLFATMFISAYQNPPASVTITPASGVVTVGDTTRLEAVALGSDGYQYEFEIAWSSLDPAVATVSDSGTVTTMAPGVARIVASSVDQRDTAEVLVRSSNPPVLDSVSPSPLRPGASVVVYGTGFDPSIGADAVTVEGVPAAVTAATATALTVIIPAAANYPCTATHHALVTVTAGGRFGAARLPLAVAADRILAAGEAVLLDAGEDRCNEVPAGGVYAVAIANTSTDPRTTVSFDVLGEGATALVATAPTPAPAAAALGPPVPGQLVHAARAARGPPNAHARVLKESREFALRAGPPAPLLAAWQRPLLSVADTIGNLARVRIPRIDWPDFCSRFTAITARRVYSGERALILEDVNAPLAGVMDGYYQQIGAEFDAVMYPLLTRYFGNPLVLDGLLDRNGQVVMVFSPIVNALSVGGFVTSCDFYPESVAPSSNAGEVLYAMVPTNPATDFDLGTRDYWRWIIRAIVLHEAKHVTTFAERLARGAPLEADWLEEGSAVLAEELWTRAIAGNAWKGNAGYIPALYCEVRPTSPQCEDRPFAMFGWFALLHDMAVSFERRSPLGPVSATDGTFYASAWALLRWATDYHAATEEAFLTALVTDPVRTGAPNLEARTGRQLGELLPDWALAFALDDRIDVAASPTRLRFPSWHLRNVFAGMAADFPNDFLPIYPYQPRLSGSGAIIEHVTALPGGAASQIHLVAPSGARQLLELTGPGGGPPPAGLRVEIMRMH